MIRSVIRNIPFLGGDTFIYYYENNNNSYYNELHIISQDFGIILLKDNIMKSMENEIKDIVELLMNHSESEISTKLFKILILRFTLNNGLCICGKHREKISISRSILNNLNWLINGYSKSDKNKLVEWRCPYCENSNIDDTNFDLIRRKHLYNFKIISHKSKKDLNDLNTIDYDNKTYYNYRSKDDCKNILNTIYSLRYMNNDNKYDKYIEVLLAKGNNSIKVFIDIENFTRPTTITDIDDSKVFEYEHYDIDKIYYTHHTELLDIKDRNAYSDNNIYKYYCKYNNLYFLDRSMEFVNNIKNTNKNFYNFWLNINIVSIINNVNIYCDNKYKMYAIEYSLPYNYRDNFDIEFLSRFKECKNIDDIISSSNEIFNNVCNDCIKLDSYIEITSSLEYSFLLLEIENKLILIYLNTGISYLKNNIILVDGILSKNSLKEIYENYIIYMLDSLRKIVYSDDIRSCPICKNKGIWFRCDKCGKFSYFNIIKIISNIILESKDSNIILKDIVVHEYKKYIKKEM